MRSLKVVGSSFMGLLLVSALATAGCSKETPSGEGAFANDLKGVAPPRRGAPGPVTKGGVPDDSVKPVPIAKGGTNDDSIKPAPVTVTKGGVPDDSVKPKTLPQPLPTPSPR
jgi:hypothetical protein